MTLDEVNILLVDDDQQTYLKTRNILQNVDLDDLQLHVTWVPNYPLALERMRQDKYQICLFDNHADGYQTMEFLAQTTGNGIKTAMIMLTDDEDEEVNNAALHAGAADYLNKGQMNAPLLQRMIRYTVRCKQLEQTINERVEDQVGEIIARNHKLEQRVRTYEEMEEELRQSETQYRRLFDIDIYAIEVLDPNGLVIDCNITFQRLVGYERQEIINEPTNKFVTARSQRILNKQLPILRRRGYAEGEIEIQRQDGNIVLVWRRFRAIYNEQGEFSGVITYSRDITDRMRAVRQISILARALEQSPRAMLITDKNGLIDYINFEFTELTGYTYEDVVGQRLRLFRFKKMPRVTFDEMWSTIVSGEEWEGEFNNVRKDNQDYWERVVATPMYNAKGYISHYIFVFEDITERLRAESEALQTQYRIGSLIHDQITDLTHINRTLEEEINERKRAEISLRRSRKRLKAQYKGIPLPTYTWQLTKNGDLVLVDYNTAAEKTSHGRVIDILGKSTLEVFKERPQVLKDFEDCVENRRLLKREAPYRLISTGEMRYFVTTYNFVVPNLIIVHIEDVTDHRNVQQGLDHVQTDLKTKYEPELNALQTKLEAANTERQRLAQALHLTEDRFKAMHDNIDDRIKEQYRTIPIPTYTWQRIGPDFILVDFNDAAAKSMGKIVDFLGHSANDIFKDRAQVLEDFESSYQQKDMVRREAPYQLVTTGEERFFVTTYHFIEPNLVVVHIEDATEQKAIEARLIEYQEKVGDLESFEPAGPSTVELQSQFELMNQQVNQMQTQLEQAKNLFQRERQERKKVSQTLANKGEELERLKIQLDEAIEARYAAEITASQAESYDEELEQLHHLRQQSLQLIKTNELLEDELARKEREEESYRQNRVRLKAQYKSIPIPTYSWQVAGDDFILVDYNDAAEKATEGRVVDIYGHSARQVFADRPQILGDFARCVREKRVLSREAPYELLSTNESRYFVSTYSYVPPNLVIVYIQDITAQRQTEMALRESEEQVELVYRLSPTGEITYVNDALCWYFGKQREHLLASRFPFVYEEDEKACQKQFNSLFPDNPVSTDQYRIIKDKDDIRWQRWIFIASFDHQDRLIEVQAIGRDVSNWMAVKEKRE